MLSDKNSGYKILHVITRKDNEQVMNVLKQGDVVISNTAHHCHPELVSGSQNY